MPNSERPPQSLFKRPTKTSKMSKILQPKKLKERVTIKYLLFHKNLRRRFFITIFVNNLNPKKALRIELKRVNLQNESLKNQVDRKTKENEELTQICDELLANTRQQLSMYNFLRYKFLYYHSHPIFLLFSLPCLHLRPYLYIKIKHIFRFNFQTFIWQERAVVNF